MFRLEAQVCGVQRHAQAEHDGYSIVVDLTGVMKPARSESEAIRLSTDHLGEFVARGRKAGVPWGLRVEVGGVAAVYGEWPLLPGRPGRPETSLVSRIRRRCNDSDPVAALDNAVEIIRAYAPAIRAAA